MLTPQIKRLVAKGVSHFIVAPSMLFLLIAVASLAIFELAPPSIRLSFGLYIVLNALGLSPNLAAYLGITTIVTHGHYLQQAVRQHLSRADTIYHLVFVLLPCIMLTYALLGGNENLTTSVSILIPVFPLFDLLVYTQRLRGRLLRGTLIPPSPNTSSSFVAPWAYSSPRPVTW